MIGFTRFPQFKVLLCIAIVLSSCNSGDRNIEEIVGRMSLQEKIEFIGGYNSFHIRPFPDYGIPEINMADGPVGVRNLGASTAYPASITLAASWDRNLAGKNGQAIGREARSKNIHIMLGPGMNIHRGPYCGRNFEYLGEDPYLAGEIASSYVVGMQEQGVVATAKHYVANYQDFDRHEVSSDMDERTLHEIYLPAFKACVQKGDVGAIMTAYNLINGIHASQHDYLLNEVLKDQWGFEGVVMSDWTSTYDGVACAKGGLDLEMPAGTYMAVDTLMPAIEAGELSEEIINDKVRRILNLYERFGYFDIPDISSDYTLNEELVRGIALEAARGGITLLRNEESLLPLQQGNINQIAVIGPNGHPAVTGGGGSSFTNPLYPVSLFEAVSEVAGTDVKVLYERGVFSESEYPEGYFSDSEFYTYVEGEIAPGISATFFNNTELRGDPVYTGIFSRLDHTLHDSVYPGLAEVNYSARFEGFFKVPESGNYKLSIAGDDGYRLFLNGKLIIDQWQNQPETILSKEIQLTKGLENKISIEYYQGGGYASIRMTYKPQFEQEVFARQLFEKAEKAVLESDLVIFSVGFNNTNETEGKDRTFNLPAGQDNMISELAKLNENCIVVVNAGGNIDMPWLDDVKALIYAWYPGQEGNIAVAEILFGLTNPSGKLPVSFESKWEDNASYTSYFDDDNNNKVYFSEGLYLGYRHFDASESMKPRYPFGFGLSFTTFEYSGIKLSKTQFRKNEIVDVSFTIKNVGGVAGAEIAQLYVADKESGLRRPVKELKGFEKVFLNEGEEKTVTISLDKDAFSYYNPEQGGWIAEPGEFEILVGSSSEEIVLTGVAELIN